MQRALVRPRAGFGLASHAPLPALLHCNLSCHSPNRQHRRPAPTVAAVGFGQYTSKYQQSSFASLDHIELERLHTQLKSAYSWLDIKASLADYAGMMVDEESVVCALVRLSAIYSHLGPADQGEVRGSGLVERLAAMAERRLPSLRPRQLAATLDALARLDFRAPPSFLQAAKRHTAANLAGFTPAQLPLLVAAFAALGQDPGSPLLGALSEALQQQQLEISPEQLAVTLAALAGLSTRPSSAALKGLVVTLRRRLDDFRPGELSDVLQALARLRLHPGEDVMRRIAARAGLRRGQSPAKAHRSAAT